MIDLYFSFKYDLDLCELNNGNAIVYLLESGKPETWRGRFLAPVKVDCQYITGDSAWGDKDSLTVEIMVDGDDIFNDLTVNESRFIYSLAFEYFQKHRIEIESRHGLDGL